MNPRPLPTPPRDEEPRAGTVQPPRTLPHEADHRDKPLRDHPQGERVESDSDEDSRSRRRDLGP